jgi:phosphoribosylformylglycinamidine cyclo-ligase
MGHRMEVFTDEASAATLIAAGKQFGIEGKIVGRVEAAERKEVVIKTGGEEIVYN